MKIKIFNIVEAEQTEKEVNEFIKNKNVKAIHYRPDGQCNNIMVVYY